MWLRRLKQSARRAAQLGSPCVSQRVASCERRSTDTVYFQLDTSSIRLRATFERRGASRLLTSLASIFTGRCGLGDVSEALLCESGRRHPRVACGGRARTAAHMAVKTEKSGLRLSAFAGCASSGHVPMALEMFGPTLIIKVLQESESAARDREAREPSAETRSVRRAGWLHGVYGT